MLEVFESYDEYEKLQIEEKALELCANNKGVPIKFLLTMKNEAQQMYIDILKPFIEVVIKETNDTK